MNNFLVSRGMTHKAAYIGSCRRNSSTKQMN